MLAPGDYHEGRLIVVAPRLNHLVQNAIGGYRCQLQEPTEQHVGFGGITLERFVEAVGQAGEPDYARELYFRYLDWHAVDQALDAALAAPIPGTAPDQVTRRPKLKLIARPAA
jgi:hypothetical protein